MKPRGLVSPEVLVLGLSAPIMAAGLVVVAMTESWPGRVAGFATVIGGSVALASDGWRTRMVAWIAAAVGMVVALRTPL